MVFQFFKQKNLKLQGNYKLKKVIVLIIVIKKNCMIKPALSIVYIFLFFLVPICNVYL